MCINKGIQGIIQFGKLFKSVHGFRQGFRCGEFHVFYTNLVIL